jgi:MFS family permease
MLPRSFWKIWTASTASNVGDGVVLVAVPLLAAQLTRDPLAVAATTIAVRLPWLLFGLFAGAIVDRTDRKRVMVYTDVARAVALIALAVVVGTDNITLAGLYVAVFAVGVLETLFDTAAMSILPAVVPTDQLERANGRLFAAAIAANSFAGPALGGLLFAAAAWVPFGFDAATFFISALLLATLAGGFRPERVSEKSIVADIKAGMRFVWRERVIRTFAIGAGVLNLGFTAAAAIFVLHAQDNLGLGEVGFGLLLASAAVGGILGAQAASRFIAAIGRYRSLLLAVALMAGGLAVMGAASSPWLAGASFAAVAFFEEVWNVVSVTYRQAATPNEMLGRVMSSFRVIAYGAFPVGAALGGAIASATGLRSTFFVGALIMAALLPLIVSEMSRADLAPGATNAR